MKHSVRYPITPSTRFTEEARDIDGNLLWHEAYIFSRMSRPGQETVRDYVRYTVVSCDLVGSELKTVLRETKPEGG